MAAVLVTGSVVGVTPRAGIGRVLEQCPSGQVGQVGSALFVAVYTGASVPTIAAGLVATLTGLTTAVLSLAGFVIAVAAIAVIVSRRAAHPLRGPIPVS